MNRTAAKAWKASKLGIAALMSAAILSAQPLVYEGGIVNAASYGMGERERNHVAPGSIAAIFGKRLADVTLQAKGVPLPFELGGSG